MRLDFSFGADRILTKFSCAECGRFGYSFTISGSQTWTDTGVDLTEGDELTLSAQTKPGSDGNCSPQGFTIHFRRLEQNSSAVGSRRSAHRQDGGEVRSGTGGK